MLQTWQDIGLRHLRESGGASTLWMELTSQLPAALEARRRRGSSSRGRERVMSSSVAQCAVLPDLAALVQSSGQYPVAIPVHSASRLQRRSRRTAQNCTSRLRSTEGYDVDGTTREQGSAHLEPHLANLLPACEGSIVRSRRIDLSDSARASLRWKERIASL